MSSISSISEYDGEPYVSLSDEPLFAESDLTTSSYEAYAELDDLGRCGVAVACIGEDLMPTEEREDIGAIKPSEWHSQAGNNGQACEYNRCHLIGFQLTGENANEKNLVTGTRYMNVEGMLPYENMVADYIHETGYHVLYRVTPVFQGSDLRGSNLMRGLFLHRLRYRKYAV